MEWPLGEEGRSISSLSHFFRYLVVSTEPAMRRCRSIQSTFGDRDRGSTATLELVCDVYIF